MILTSASKPKYININGEDEFRKNYFDSIAV